MTSGIPFVVTAATASSIVVVVASLTVVVSLFSDINNFYDGVITEIDDFKVGTFFFELPFILLHLKKFFCFSHFVQTFGRQRVS